MGQVSDGDIARAHFAGAPKLVGMEKAGNDDLYVLDLMALERTATYPRVRYWVRQADFRPYRARVLFAFGPAAQDLPVRRVQGPRRESAPDKAREWRTP